jgi:putative SbcD/Mre11-related phosphoesterase
MLITDEWLLTPQRVAVHLPTATAVLADLHLGYHAARRRRGEAVPLPMLANLLAPLGEVVKRYSLSSIVVAGDLFEDGADRAVMSALPAWVSNHNISRLAVVPGNHDRRLGASVAGLDVFPDGIQLDSWLVVHGDQPLPQRRRVVCGHWHPSLQLGTHRYPCYLMGKGILVLPAYCREARGVSVNQSRAWQRHSCYVPTETEVLDMGPVAAVNDSLKRTGSRRWPRREPVK